MLLSLSFWIMTIVEWIENEETKRASLSSVWKMTFEMATKMLCASFRVWWCCVSCRCVVQEKALFVCGRQFSNHGSACWYAGSRYGIELERGTWETCVELQLRNRVKLRDNNDSPWKIWIAVESTVYASWECTTTGPLCHCYGAITGWNPLSTPSCYLCGKKSKNSSNILARKISCGRLPYQDRPITKSKRLVWLNENVRSSLSWVKREREWWSLF